ncbi:tunicamycin resistance protein [Paenibacillus profundus]|uniref:Tunicamycin resistance protein n=1 Tax=Paenibacillus profundus TaxID=1173085 RepID=A0ABS8YIZ5_9BACL|nr:tunicamycin resistance protein [Paenibacillus profundus]MCE5171890.1 tunicamycin resistance protein [Paenibacillus profundus]
MILWINGTFGAGKTTLSYELDYLLPDSMRYDPEDLGSHLMNVIPAEVAENDFQHYLAWREMVVSVLTELSSRLPQKTIIVPMTLTNQLYREQIFGGLKDNGIDSKEIVLDISNEKLLVNLSSRGEGADSWPYKQFSIKRQEIADIQAFKINVDDLTIDDVVNEVVDKMNLSVIDDPRTEVEKEKMRKKYNL